MKDSAPDPLILNSGINVVGIIAIDSVVLENPNRDPDPRYAFVFLSGAVPVKVKIPDA